MAQDMNFNGLNRNNVTTGRRFAPCKFSGTLILLLMLILAGGNITAAGVVVRGNVFGGGNEAPVSGSVEVNMTGGTVNGDVYGGGAKADTNTDNWDTTNNTWATGKVDGNGATVNKTVVKLNGGTIEGDAYGGGLGVKAVAEDLENGISAVEGVAANVYGDVTVYLGCEEKEVNNEVQVVAATNATAFKITNYGSPHEDVVKSGRVFGCNNQNGAPQGNVTVNVYKTRKGNVEKTAAADLHNDNATHTYHVASVYGGGNLANYAPVPTGKKTHVNILTCDVSVESVYGGGNAAAVPGTEVLVKGAYEIGFVFGGGNGKDPWTLDNGAHWTANAGADVIGNANTLLNGGFIHEAYGGSNEKGNITGSASLVANETEDRACDLDVVKLVGAGKNADIDGDAIVILGCMPATQIDQVFGGADNANVNGNVELTITSGSFRQVFGGNNESGMIKGHIKLNIEETGCRPINIEELYLGGNQAAYSIYGYYDSGETDQQTGKKIYLPRTSTANHTAEAVDNPDNTDGKHPYPYADPELNIISCTSIGQVFGGGLGENAKMYGNPTVNVDQIFGKAYVDNDPSKAYTQIATTLGSIGDVYGGGKEANVFGKATVNIGTTTTVALVTEPTHLGASGTAYTQNETTNLYEVDVQGANLTGNVYGGGKQADINGDTEVNVGTVTYNTENHVGVSIANAKSVFGGGEGQSTTVTGDVTVNIGAEASGSFTGNSVVGGDVYGGSALGAVNATKGAEYATNSSDIAVTVENEKNKETKVNIYAGTVSGNVFGGGLGQKNGLNGATSDIAAQNFGDATVTMKGGTVSTAVYGGANVNGTLKANSTVKIIGGTVNAAPGEGESLADAVFGGGLGESTSVVGDVTVNIGNYDADAETNKITGNATVNGHVYGGSAKGSVNNADAGIADDDTQTKNKHTYVNLYAGTVTGDVYGGGLGYIDEGDDRSKDIAALVYGDVAVKLNDHDGTADVGGRVFGCNNLKGTPKGAVTVDVYKTARKDAQGTVLDKPARIGDPDPTNDPKPSAYLTATDTEVDNQTYELAAVFGGGNQAAYAPTSSSGVTTVNIHNCETNSIREVYGGGNAADVPNCAVNINGAWEIGYVYGGGNGTTDIAANVTGNATTTIRGGTIYRTFGGSNTHGDIGASTLNIADGDNSDVCQQPHLGDVFSYGNRAEMNNPATVNLSCLANKVGALYGGAMNANVNSDITLNVNGGSYAKVFGGNKTGGSINGFITVNVEEGSCPINIDDLYGCGNEAPYSIYGTEKNGEGNWIVKTENTAAGFPKADPQINLRSFTRINNVYGGGLGASAVVLGTPTVNVNVIKAANDYTLNNVYGGGSMASVTGNTIINIGTASTVTMATVTDDPATTEVDESQPSVASAAITGDVFGGGYGHETTVTGTATINIGERSGTAGSYTYTDHGASFSNNSNIYGGSALGEVATSEVNLYAGSIAANVFGGGKGRLASGTEGEEGYVEPQGATISTKATVNLCAATVTGNIYGGCNDNGTTEVAELNLLGGTVGASGTVGDMVFGGGKGHATTTTTATVNVGTQTTGENQTIYAGTSSIYSNVYGGSALGAVGTAIVNLNSVTTLAGHVFGGGMGEGTAEETKATITTSATVNQYAIAMAADKDIYGGCNVNGTAEATTVNLLGGSVRDVFGGGLGQHTGVTGNVLVEVGRFNGTDAVSGTATVTRDVYGGSAKGAVNTNTDNTTKVNLWKGTVNGDVYGGGLGDKASMGEGHADIAAVVNGNVRVNLNGYDSGTETVTPVSMGECVVKGSIFGGNNANGSPAGTAEVHIYNTVGWTDDHGTPGDASDDISHVRTATPTTADAATYELIAVYGGGNLAAFTGTTTNVVIETCNPSIKSVYGGGNAADATNTSVLVKGAYEIGTVFGGGNGEVSAANVPGTATTVLNGGLIHDFYGGSNTRGTIGTFNSQDNTTTGGPVITIDDLYTKNGIGCLLQFDNIYGAGKNANVDGNISMTMGCLSDAFTVQNLYGGAKSADVRGNVTLTVTSGQFTNVFGGNDASGTIGGNITVNVEETGCQPLKISNVYGGGNLAPYTGNTTVNLKSFTSVGNVYGGGLGATAIVTGSTTVNVNQVPGDKAALIDADDNNVVDNNVNALGTVGNVYGGGSEASVAGNTNVNIGTLSTVTMASLEDDASTTEDERVKNVTGVNITGDVYGGGYGHLTNVSENVAVVIGATANTYSPAIGGDVYGGSALGTVNGTTADASKHTNVTLNKGVVTGSVYGGGLGDATHAASVNGAVTVTVNGGKAANVFGCNNVNGSPQSTVAVYIKGTDAVPIGQSAIGNVYGGGNMAKYTYTGATPLLVEISGGTTYSTEGQSCTIGNVYGGGLSADVRGSITVNIKGGKVLGDVYGGGALANTNTANWTVTNESDWGKWQYDAVTLESTTHYEPLGILGSNTLVTGKYTYNSTTKEYEEITTSGTMGDGITEYFEKHVGMVSAGYYIKEGDNYVPAPTDWAEDNTTYSGSYYSRKIKGEWASDMSSGTTYKTEVNLTGGVVGDVYGGGLGNTDVSAIVYGDVTVTLGDGTKATGMVQNMETPAGSSTAVPVSGRVFGCNNINGTPLGNVTVRVNNTQQLDGDEQPVSGHSDNKYDVHSVYGGGNQARYEPATGKETKVLIYGCEKTSIEKVFGGGNSAAVPKTTVVIVGTHRIGYVFGGGNGADMIKKGSTWVANDGAPVYGDATVIAIGGKIGMTFAGSDTKGTVWGNATTKLNDGNGNISEYEDTEHCPLKITHSYGAGRGADINADVNFIVNGCTNNQIETIFGGSYDANIRGDINLTITGGVYTQVFGGNDHGGNIGGNINVNIEESETCNPTIIQYLYGGSREAKFPGDNAKNKAGTSVTRGKITVNVKSATRIDNVYGGGWRAVINGDTEVNINMIEGAWANHSYTLPTDYRGNQIPNSNMSMTYSQETVTVGETIVTGLYTKDGDNYIQVTEQEEKAKENVVYYKGTPTGTILIDPGIGTIGNIYGGSYQSTIHGNATVNIGTAGTVDILKREGDTPGGTLLNEAGNPVYDASGNVNTDEGIARTVALVQKDVLGAHITGNVYGGGDLAAMDKYEVKTQTGTDPDTSEPIYTTTYAGGNTFVNICAVKNGDNYDAVVEATEKVTIEGNVYGGGRGLADNFFCRAGMVGHEGDNVGQAPDTKDGTTIRIGNGTVKGSVYGGGEVARVEWSSDVTVGLNNGVTSAPVIEGNVFGGGKGVSTHGYSALLRGDTHVTVQANAKVRECVYGGGEIASVGRYNVATEENAATYGVEPGMPYSLFDARTGQCHVFVQGNAEIGPATAMTMPTFLGNVFGGGKGVLPYEGYADNENPWRMPPTNDRQYYTDKDAYLKYVETLALATRTYVTIDENAFVKGSVYGGSEEGVVQQNTLVKIKGGQIGAGYDYDTSTALAKYNDADFIDPTSATAEQITTKAGVLKECHHWPYVAPYDTYDMYADASGNYPSGSAISSSEGGSPTGKDGHTYYGNVFGGGCGKDPYRPGEWHNRAGAVGGNTEVRITGGHILTNVYGGNEMTNVGTEGVDTTGVCIITMSGGTLGVPRTLDQIKNHPVTCYLFGAGKGDERVLFNKETNVRDVVVSVTGGTIYGSVFGGGEDGHVQRDVTMTIGNSNGTGPKIGTWGTSYVDGNVFGGGRGFSGEAYTAGNVAGSIDLTIQGGTMLGSIYGGGRLGSVGYGLYDATTNGNPTQGYGEMRDDDKLDNGTTTTFYNTRIANWHNLGRGRGHIDIDISGGTIGNKYEFVDVPANTSDLDTWKTTNHVPNTEYNTTTTTEGNTTTYTHRLKHTKGGNVFAGSMGRRTKLDGTPIPEPTKPGDIDWRKLGNAKSTKLTISGTPWIMGNVYGGGEFGTVTGYHNLLDGEGDPIKDANDVNMVAGAEIVVTGGTIGTEITASAPVKETVAASSTVKYTFGSIYGGGMGIKTDGGGEVMDSTNVSVSGASTLVRASVFGGGELGNVDGNTLVTIAGGKIGRNEVRPAAANDPKEGYVMYGGATMGNVYGGGFGDKDETEAALVKKNTRVIITGGEIYHNVYGGGALSSVGTFSISDGTGDNAHIPAGIPYGWTTGTGNATVIITGGTIGISGRDNGMVNGSSRGEVAKPTGTPAKDPYDKLAWVNETFVTIGKTGETGPNIKGSVYGGGENGHNAGNATVKMYSGKVGVFTGDTWATFTNDEAIKKASITRGNVYGAGCGTDTYTGDDNLEHNNPWAGLVAGNAYVTVSGGEVSNNVYGGGSMGAVGTITNDLDADAAQHKTGDNANLGEAATLYDFGLSWPLVINYASGTGLASVTVDGTAVIDGYVFGAARGNVDIGENDITKHRYVEAKFANVRETQVTIGTAGGSAATPTIKHSVFGGGEDGHVYENASVTIHHGKIERSVFGGGKGEGTYTTMLYAIDPAYPNDDTKHIELNNQTAYSWTAGRVYGNTEVTMNGGTVEWFIYGGGNLGSVGVGNYAGGDDDYSKAGYGELPSANGNLWTTTYTEENDTKDMAYHFLNSGIATVNIFGGTVGTGSGTDEGIPLGSVFGGSRGKAAASCKRSPRYRYVPDFFLGYVNKAIINIGDKTKVNDGSYTGPTIYGSVYGGGQDGHVRNSTEVKIYKGDIHGLTSDVSGRSGHVFGAGSGIGTYDTGKKDALNNPIMAVNNSSGSVTCTTLVEVNGGTIKGNVYGGGALASVGPPKTPAQSADEQKEVLSTSTVQSCSHTQVDIKGGRIGGSVFAASRGPSDAYLTTAPIPVFDTSARVVGEVTIPAGSYDETKYATDLWSELNVTGGTVEGSVYGGSEGGIVKHDTKVSLTGGTIKKDAYGGGKGTANIAANVNGNTTVELNNNNNNQTANGNVAGCAVNRVFGCNDYKGTPLGHVMVHVYATQRAKANTTILSGKFPLNNRIKSEDETKKVYLARLIAIAKPNGTCLRGVDEDVITEAQTTLSNTSDADANAVALDTPIAKVINEINGSYDVYDVEAVYGGGNLAPYEPTDATSSDPVKIDQATTQVIIDGCELTSIRQVYGGGNAASTPATDLTVNGTYEIFEAFGGGNGADNYQHPITGKWHQNPGANVGYKDFTHEGTGTGNSESDPILSIDNDNATGTEDEDKLSRKTNYGYGSGVASTNIRGGKVHNVYGGSNKRGNISTTLLSVYESMFDDCPIDVDQSYGGGKDAQADGSPVMQMECAKGVKEMFGGAKNSDVYNDVVLTITNGSSLDRVFGGNNTSGAITGSITVNIEEGGCEPIRIGQLYAGGYLAPYSVYGYETDDNGTYKTEDITYEGIGTVAQRIPITRERWESLNQSHVAKKDPRINVISATRIDYIYGGGYQAKVVGNPHVNVNMTNGKVEVENKGTDDNPSWQDVNAVEYNILDITTVTVGSKTKSYATLPVGTIGTIYGGGNLADIDGDTYVEIGTGEWLNKNDEREMRGTYSDNTTTISTPTTFIYDNTLKKWTYEKASTTNGSSITPVEGSTINGSITVNSETINTKFTYTSNNWTYGSESTVVDFSVITPANGSVIQGTISNVTTATTFTYDATSAEWSYTAPEPINGTPVPFRNAATIDGNVFGGGKGQADHFECAKAQVLGPNGTSVVIANGTVKRTLDAQGNVIGGNVYGGGEVGRVEWNTEVTVGIDGVTENASFKPVVEGNVFGAGKGKNTHGYSALVRGKSTVAIQGDAVIGQSVYGGGEVASVGRYKVVGGLPQTLDDSQYPKSGYCYVTVKDNAVIGPDNMLMNKVDGEGNPLPPDDTGYVFGAGKGVLPYEGYDDDVEPYHMNGTQVLSPVTDPETGETVMAWDGKTWADDPRHYPAYNNSHKNDKVTTPDYYNEDAYFKFVRSMALATQTEVKVEGNAFVKGGVYGGAENGFVQHDTHVVIGGKCQIGNGHILLKDPTTGNIIANRGLNRRYTDAEWAADHLIVTDADFTQTELADGLKAKVEAAFANSLPECASWPYGEATVTANKYVPYDKYAGTEGYTSYASTTGDDGHTFYGNVFGGGSGYFPYRPGKWFEFAGAVHGNTVVEVKGGHILTSLYGGNEMTDVGEYTVEGNEVKYVAGGTSYVTMTGGTLGVPRTLNQIKNHPVTCYLFGAGKGDPRTFFNESTNVGNAVIHVSDDARIYGSVFGGGEDGHVMENVKLTIGSKTLPTLPTSVTSAYSDAEKAELTGSKNVTVGTGDAAKAIRYPLIGTTGTSYVDGNVFGAGRGYSGDALTAGSIGGNVEVNIEGGTMLGSVYGGGRLASVGIPFAYETSSQYGSFTDDPVTPATYYAVGEDIPEGKEVGDEKTAAVVNKLHGHVTVNISGGTIGNDLENQFFTPTVTITDDMTEEQIATARAEQLEAFKTANKIPYTEFEYDAENNKYIPTHTKGGNVFGGSMGRLELLDGSPNTKLWPQLGQVKTATVNISQKSTDVPTVIKDCVYGGGELGPVRDSTTVVIGKESKDATTLSRPTIYRDIYGGGYGSKINDDSYIGFVESEDLNGNPMVFMYTPMKWAGLVGIKTDVNIYDGWVKRNVYGGGELASVGIIDYHLKQIESPDDYDNEKDYIVSKVVSNQTVNYHFAKEYANIVEHGDVDNSFALSWPYKVDYFPGYSGDTYINVRGGRIGVSDADNTWKDNGDIYGGSKGMAGDRYEMAFCGNVGSSNILIDYPSTNTANLTNYQTETSLGSYPKNNDCIVGAVYGGGEDGHVMGDTHVTLKNGLIGHSLYGGGSGKGKYNAKRLIIGAKPLDDTLPKDQWTYKPADYVNADIYSITAGKVYGNTHVRMEGGYVGRFVYGGGNMGSVGKGNYAGATDDYSYYGSYNGYGEHLHDDADDSKDEPLWTPSANFNPNAPVGDNNQPVTMADHFLSSGKTEVEIFGGTIGYINTDNPSESMKDGLPYGSVFGGSRGESAPNIGESPRYLYSPEFFSGYVNETKVTIGDATKLNDENYKAPKILGSVFGGGQDGHVRRDTHVIVDAGEIGLSLSGKDLEQGNNARTNVTILGGIQTNGKDNVQWLHRGNVYGAGSGIGKYKFDFDNDKVIDETGTEIDYTNPQTGRTSKVKEIDYSTSAGSVTRFTKVEVKGGTIHRNVYGGGSMSSVGPPKIPPTRTDGDGFNPYNDAHKDDVGRQTLNEVTVGGAKDLDGKTVRVTIGDATSVAAGYGGSVFGAGRGDLNIGEDFGTSVWTNVFIKDGAKILRNVFGGGDNGKVKQDTDVQIGERKAVPVPDPVPDPDPGSDPEPVTP